jgi:diguanylate cyclase (GGDEF)-like protein
MPGSGLSTFPSPITRQARPGLRTTTTAHGMLHRPPAANGRRFAPWCRAIALGLGLFVATAHGDDRRHPLEILALSEPKAALQKIEAARRELGPNDRTLAAKLALAEANACRVIADYRCQRRAGTTAMAEADRTDSVYLQVRARIAIGRSLSRLGDFNNAARTLAEAQRRLGREPDDELMADVLLAYSSISERLGKLDESYRYAKEGLNHASAAKLPEMRLRLLRNMAHIASAQGRPQEARALMSEAKDILPTNRDPKLTGEVLLEEARAAFTMGDADTVEDMGRRIGAIGEELRNSQLSGLGSEMRAQALLLRGDDRGALGLYRKAGDEFAGLGLQADELRVLRAIVDLQIKGVGAETLPDSIAQLTRLSDQINKAERAAAASDFEERLRYAESDTAVATANAKAEAERLRARVNEDKFRYTLVAGTFAVCLLGLLAILYSQQRRYAAVMRERGREMEVAISTDFLTSVHSRRFITDAGLAAMQKARERGGGFAVAVIDIDHFKRINDRYGHAVGDEVLKAVAQAMRAVCRDSDTLGRYGGEEFAVLLDGIGQEHVSAAAERLRNAVANVRMHVDDETIAPTASVGVAYLSPQDQEFGDLLVRADRALYAAKGQGRDRVVIADGPVEAASSVTSSDALVTT